MPIITLPDGKTIEIPSNLDSNQVNSIKQKIAQEYANYTPKGESVSMLDLGRYGYALKNVGKGAVETALSGASGLASLVDIGNDNPLTQDLQKAEAYGDNLRNRLRELDLVQDAIRDSANLEGRMNGATAKLWRELEAATGGDGDTPLPNWLLDVPRTGDQSSNTDREDNSTDSSSTKTD